MDSSDTAATAANSTASRFTARISDETFVFHDVVFDDRKVTGAQVAEAAGAHPVADYVVLVQLPSRELETVRPTELVDLKEPSTLFVIKGDGTDKFVIDGLSLEWPRKALSGAQIKWLIGKGDDDVELVLERQDRPDQVIEDEDEVRVGAAGVEKLYTRPAKFDVTIIVNLNKKPWNKRKISFDEVVKLAYPVPPPSAPGQELVFTVGYFDGPPAHPQGSLVQGQSVRVRDEMAFDVKFTNKS